MSDERYEALRDALFWDAFWAFLPWMTGVSLAAFALIYVGYRMGRKSTASKPHQYASRKAEP